MVKVEPLDKGEGVVFESQIKGAAIPNVIPAIEKALEKRPKRSLAGFPVVDTK